MIQSYMFDVDIIVSKHLKYVAAALSLISESPSRLGSSWQQSGDPRCCVHPKTPRTRVQLSHLSSCRNAGQTEKDNLHITHRSQQNPQGNTKETCQKENRTVSGDWPSVFLLQRRSKIFYVQTLSRVLKKGKFVGFWRCRWTFFRRVHKRCISSAQALRASVRFLWNFHFSLFAHSQQLMHGNTFVHLLVRGRKNPLSCMDFSWLVFSTETCTILNLLRSLMTKFARWLGIRKARWMGRVPEIVCPKVCDWQEMKGKLSGEARIQQQNNVRSCFQHKRTCCPSKLHHIFPRSSAI